jgi:hypothetical protein
MSAQGNGSDVDVTTVGELRAALASEADETPISDMLGEVVLISSCHVPETEDRIIVIS